MPISRREFLRSSTVAALFASLALHPLKSALAQKSEPDSQRTTADATTFQTPQEAKRDPVFYFTKSTFEPHLNTDFVVRAGVIVTTLRLVEVEDCAATGDDAGGTGECFSLTFRASRELSDVRTIHVFEHAALGEFNMFVSETKKFKDPDGLYYAAVINHRVGGAAPAKRTALRQGQSSTPPKKRP